MRENTRGYRRKTVNLHVELVSDDWASIGKRRTLQYSLCVTNENNNTCVGLD
jgi:hypothetical protein